MLRNIIITIGFLVALDPYLGFPDYIDTFILTGLGMSLIFVVVLSRRVKVSKHDAPTNIDDYREDSESPELQESPKILHVERTEVEDTPQVHIERITTVDKEITQDSFGEDTEVEKKTTVVRKRKQKMTTKSADLEELSENDQIT